MNTKYMLLAGAALLIAPIFTTAFTQAAHGAAAAGAQSGKRYVMHRLYTGPDGKTHVEDVEAKFGAKGTDPFKLMAAPGAEIRRAAPGRVADWHTAPRRQYVITLSGRGEVELEDGTKIELGPGSIDLAEDLTGKGHITRVIGNEERITLAIPVAEK